LEDERPEGTVPTVEPRIGWAIPSEDGKLVAEGGDLGREGYAGTKQGEYERGERMEDSDHPVTALVLWQRNARIG
jgi:hypothetical protein